MEPDAPPVQGICIRTFANLDILGRPLTLSAIMRTSHDLVLEDGSVVKRAIEVVYDDGTAGLLCESDARYLLEVTKSENLIDR